MSVECVVKPKLSDDECANRNRANQRAWDAEHAEQRRLYRISYVRRQRQALLDSGFVPNPVGRPKRDPEASITKVTVQIFMGTAHSQCRARRRARAALSVALASETHTTHTHTHTQKKTQEKKGPKRSTRHTVTPVNPGVAMRLVMRLELQIGEIPIAYRESPYSQC